MNFKKSISPRGQAGLEYMAMAIFVTLGIFIAGPYVVRSINGYFKSAEEGTRDSSREKIVQAPEQGDIHFPPCDLSEWEFTGACSDGKDGCAKRQQIWARFSTPQGCEVDQLTPQSLRKCENDTTFSCCDPSHSTGNCGNLAIHAPGGACPTGMVEHVALCGSPGTINKFTCQADSACATKCDDYNPQYVEGPCDASKFTANIGSGIIRAVDYGKCSSDENFACKIQCKLGAYSIGGSCMPRCGNGTCEDGLEGRPNYGENIANCPDDCSGEWCKPIFQGKQSDLWQKFMEDYAIWVTDHLVVGDAATLVGDVAAFKIKFTVATDDIYTLKVAADNILDVFIDGNKVCSSFYDEASFYNNPTGKVCPPLNLLHGDHNLYVKLINAGNCSQAFFGGSYDCLWSRNPAGFGLEITDKTKNIIVSTEDPNIWLSQTHCSNNCPWKCDIRTCSCYVCGDGVCDSAHGENTTNCPQDCQLQCDSDLGCDDRY